MKDDHVSCIGNWIRNHPVNDGCVGPFFTLTQHAQTCTHTHSPIEVLIVHSKNSIFHVFAGKAEVR